MTDAGQRVHRVVVVDPVLDRARKVAAVLGASGSRHVEVVPSAESVDPAADAVLVRLGEDGGVETLRDLAALIERGVPVIALGERDAPAIRRRALGAGARDFMAVGDAYIEELDLRLDSALALRDVHTVLERDAHRLRREVVDAEQRMSELTVALEESHLEALERLVLAAEYRDDASFEHPQRVARTTALMGRQMGLPEAQLARLGFAAQLHDIGKIGVPDEIMLKPGRLDSS
jgi:putative two-component system response regulator